MSSWFLYILWREQLQAIKREKGSSCSFLTVESLLSKKLGVANGCTLRNCIVDYLGVEVLDDPARSNRKQ